MAPIRVMNLGEGATARVCVAAIGDTVAVIGDNHKLLLFPVADMPEMSKGRGVVMQRYHDGGLSDAKIITLAFDFVRPTGDEIRNA